MRVFKPLHDDVFSSVCRRIVYRLIELAYKRNPDSFTKYAPDAVYGLGHIHRTLFPELWPWFLFFSKNMACGCTTQFLRDCALPDAPRSVHKRRLHRVPR